MTFYPTLPAGTRLGTTPDRCGITFPTPRTENAENFHEAVCSIGQFRGGETLASGRRGLLSGASPGVNAKSAKLVRVQPARLTFGRMSASSAGGGRPGTRANIGAQRTAMAAGNTAAIASGSTRKSPIPGEILGGFTAGSSATRFTL